MVNSAVVFVLISASLSLLSEDTLPFLHQAVVFFLHRYDEVLYRSSQDLQPKHIVSYLLTLW